MSDMFLPQPFPPFNPQDRGGGDAKKPISEWGMLSRGKTIGKRTVVSTASVGLRGAASPVDIFTLQADDEYALNLNVCLSPPKYLGATPPLPADLQSISTTYLNSQLDPTVVLQQLQGYPTYAIIEWGIGGVSNVAEVDFSNGANVAISASFVRVRGVLSPDDGLTATPFNVVEMSAFVGPGFPRNNVAQRSYLDEINAASYGAIHAVPTFAKTVSGSVYDKSSDPLVPVTTAQIIFYMTVLGSANPDNVLSYGVLTPGTKVPIPSGALFFQVYNTSANTARASSVFDLAL